MTDGALPHTIKSPVGYSLRGETGLVLYPAAGWCLARRLAHRDHLLRQQADLTLDPVDTEGTVLAISVVVSTGHQPVTVLGLSS